MIKKVLLCSVLIVGGLSLFNMEDHQSYSNSSGSPAGYTGAPTDADRTCRTCHGGGSAVEQEGIITTNIPASGYIAGQTYNITVAYNEAGRNKYGFEITTVPGAGTNKGVFSVTGTQVKTIGSGRVTHTSTGSVGAGGKTWTFSWKAPTSTTNSMSFYACVNAANNNGTDDAGDNIYTSVLQVKEDVSSGIADYLTTLGESISLYPMPAAQWLHIATPAEFGAVKALNVYDLTGKQVMTSVATEALNIEALPAGTYVLKIEGEQAAVKRFVKQ
ncbi:MAG: choice-of-anchor V domain-containing protein [Bacteroidota bacterium]